MCFKQSNLFQRTLKPGRWAAAFAADEGLAVLTLCLFAFAEGKALTPGFLIPAPVCALALLVGGALPVFPLGAGLGGRSTSVKVTEERTNTP